MEVKLIVGLGNPGEKYAKVRHNLGWMVLDELVDNWEENKKLKSLIAKKDDLIFAKPLTFMNNSGLAVKALTTYYKLPAVDLIVIHDDLDLMLGQIKVRMGGSAAGHHGVESIISALGTDQFTRVRLGIGNQKSHSGEHQRIHFEAEKFVLEPFEPNELPQVKHMIKQAIKEIHLTCSVK
ncbi:TPA: aminoacyl-tRNA hydrolase [Candidatus Daviesbacteria bacterium]|nr:aminoacyl-tRNA hydrolase [Candidatus Daviesbacteria bacterium]HCB22954.1 aminoacyl-tRNA hydrolase [Candidatus Daviesbacteria bacterium]